MFLYAKKFIYLDELNKQDELTKLIKEKLKIKEDIFSEMDGYELKELKWEVGYWRKSNQIHNWFVQNIQKGEDDCGNYDVRIEQLKKLLDIVIEILKEKGKKRIEKAKELLETKEGFFFGGYKYDKYYFDDLKQTKMIIEKLFKIKNIDNYDIEYHSSW